METGFKCKKTDWSQKRQGIKNGKPHAQIINDGLNRIKNQIEGFALELRANGKAPTAKAVKALMKGEKDMNVFTAWDKFTKDRVHNIKFQSQGSYAVIIRDIKEYGEARGKQIDFSVFNEDFYFRFNSYLKEKGNKKTTINRKVTQLKAFLDYSLRQGFHKQTSFKNWKTTREGKVSDTIALTRHEVGLIQNARLTGSKAKVRDLFIFQCHTGLRYSDTQKIEQGQVFNSILHFDNVKAGKRSSVALSSVAIEIYKRGIPKMSNQYYAPQIKEICKGIGESFLDDCNHKGKIVPRWQAVSSHTARRTFITIMLEVAPLNLVKNIVGHSSTNITEGYDKTEDEAKYKAVREVWG